LYKVTRELSFSYGHRLIGHQGRCARLHGHNARLRVTLGAESLDRMGMVLDFFDIKKTLSGWIEETIDHRLVLRADDPVAKALRDLGEPFLAVDFSPTAENLARYVFDHLDGLGLPILEVALHETDGCAAVYAREGS
jgi:6-pyruvoyltetrahydropterin/6-carboxytetrahydropterin synthase